MLSFTYTNMPSEPDASNDEISSKLLFVRLFLRCFFIHVRLAMEMCFTCIVYNIRDTVTIEVGSDRRDDHLGELVEKVLVRHPEMRIDESKL